MKKIGMIEVESRPELRLKLVYPAGVQGDVYL